MSKPPFKELPLLVKIVTALTLFNSWVLFEETVVDRQGLWRYLPLYKVGVFCTWDLVGLGAAGLVVWLASVRPRADSKTS